MERGQYPIDEPAYLPNRRRAPAKFLDDPRNPAVIIFPPFQRGVFLSVIGKYLLVMMRRVRHEGPAFSEPTLALS